jgi:hypothetical protein
MEGQVRLSQSEFLGAPHRHRVDARRPFAIRSIAEEKLSVNDTRAVVARLIELVDNVGVWLPAVLVKRP